MWTFKSSLAVGGGALLSALFLAIVFGTGAFAPTSQPSIFDPSSFAGLSDVKLEGALDDIARNRTQMEREVVDQLSKGGDDKKSELAAVYLAGLYRFGRASPSLARLITMSHPFWAGARMPFFSDHPAYTALVQIGDQSLPALLGVLDSDGSPDARRAAAGAVREILGAGPGKCFVAAAVDAARKSGNQERARRLTSALPLLEYANPFP